MENGRYIYIYIYMFESVYVCMCCMCAWMSVFSIRLLEILKLWSGDEKRKKKKLSKTPKSILKSKPLILEK